MGRVFIDVFLVLFCVQKLAWNFVSDSNLCVLFMRICFCFKQCSFLLGFKVRKLYFCP